MDYVSYTLLCEELGRVDSSVRGFLTVHASLVSLCIQDWGSEEQLLAFAGEAEERRHRRSLRVTIVRRRLRRVARGRRAHTP